jgi:hypothetical protein
MLFEERLGGEERRLMHLVPANRQLSGDRWYKLRIESPGTYMCSRSSYRRLTV